MQSKNKPFRLLIVVLAASSFWLPLQAQVNIGDNAAPNTFSLLEINVLHQSGGLRLPQLTAAQCDSLNGVFTSPSTSAADKAAAQGLVVYNTGTGCVEFWCGDNWISLCDGSGPSAYVLPPPACEAPDQPGPITGSKYASPNMAGSVTYSVPAVDGVSYTWTLPVGWTGSSTSASITPTLTEMAESGTISVTANNGACSSKPATFNVIAGRCGAYIASGEWRVFMCWNLGANYNADPFTPSKELNGDYYNWGSPIPAATRDDIIGVWGSTVIIDNIDNHYGDGISHGSPPSINNQKIKSATDPCPIGYRVPNYYEVYGMRANNTWTPLGSFENDGNFTSGQQVGNVLYLPAAGRHDKDTGDLLNRGSEGLYWSSSYFNNPSSLDNWAYVCLLLSFYDYGPGTLVGLMNNNSGLPIRCIRE